MRVTQTLDEGPMVNHQKAKDWIPIFGEKIYFTYL